jgi:hypothetical protein
MIAKSEAGAGRPGVRRNPKPEVGDLEHEARTLELRSHRDRAVIAVAKGVEDRVGDRLRDGELDVVPIDSPGLRVFGNLLRASVTLPG